MTTFGSYGQVASARQSEIIQNRGKSNQTERPILVEFAKAVAGALANPKEFAKNSLLSEKNCVDSEGKIRGVKLRTRHRSKR